MNIGIVGARKYRDRKSVIDLVNSLPADSVIVTSGCAGVCTWVKEAAEKRGMVVILFAPDLSNIRAWFEVPKRYYQRNKGSSPKRVGEMGQTIRSIVFRNKGLRSWNGFPKMVLIFHGTISKTLGYISVSWLPSAAHGSWRLWRPQSTDHPAGT